MVVGRWSPVAGNPPGERPPTTDPKITEHIACACVTFGSDAQWYIDWQGLWNRLPIPNSGYGRIGMCSRSEPLLFTRDVFRVVLFRVFLFQLILAVSVAWQDASTGALRGVVLDAHGAAIT